MTETWERQPEETDRSWTAFAAFRELGPTRTIVGVRTDWGTVGARLGHVETSPPSKTSLDRWARDHSWRIRAEAYDAHLDRMWQLEVSSRRRESARQAADTATRAMSMVAKRLQLMLDLDLWREWDVLDVRRLMDSASKLQRLALGDSTENVQVTGKNGGPIEHEDVSFLTDEDRHRRMRQLIEEAERRLADVEEAQQGSRA